MSTDLNKMRELAQTVGEDHEVMAGAYKLEHRARVELFAAILAAVAPARTALASRVQVFRDNHPGHAEHERFAEWRGVKLAGPERTYDKKRGLVRGSALYLATDGTLIELSYQGMFFLDKTEDWSAMECAREISYVAEWYDPDVVARTLFELLEKQSDGNPLMRAEQSDKLAAKMRAIADLLT